MLYMRFNSVQELNFFYLSAASKAWVVFFWRFSSFLENISVNPTGFASAVALLKSKICRIWLILESTLLSAFRILSVVLEELKCSAQFFVVK